MAAIGVDLDQSRDRSLLFTAVCGRGGNHDPSGAAGCPLAQFAHQRAMDPLAAATGAHAGEVSLPIGRHLFAG